MNIYDLIAERTRLHKERLEIDRRLKAIDENLKPMLLSRARAKGKKTLQISGLKFTVSNKYCLDKYDIGMKSAKDRFGSSFYEYFDPLWTFKIKMLLLDQHLQLKQQMKDLKIVPESVNPMPKEKYTREYMTNSGFNGQYDPITYIK